MLPWGRMPSFPRLSAAASSLPSSIFARLYERLSRFSGDVIPLQIGDTYRAPPLAARFEQQPFVAQAATTADARELYAYAPPAGWGQLIEHIVGKVSAQNKIATSTNGVQITCGATHALSCAVAALLDPGDELLLLTPHWPLIHGIAQSRSVMPVEVNMTQELLAGTLSPSDGIAAQLTAALTPNTRAIYICSPNNPDGYVYSAEELGHIARFAAAHDLWILSDEVYEDYVYSGVHTSIASLPEATGRTLTVFSFSKSYGMAGLRLGYVVGPDAVIAAVRKMANHSVYNVPQALQRAALAAMQSGGEFLVQARQEYLAAGELVQRTLAAPASLPRGSTYLFLDLRRWSEHGNSLCVLEEFAEAGVLLAPGAAFGDAYKGFARLCFTAVDQVRLVEGVARMNQVLAKHRSHE